ncbi:hypothetical protein ACO0LO_14025 [Undibacterium sp. TJN25]|uniref:hypothetical protein n=1 Tax=Undibacterium sp. TJN25 TaxID=3413056 RepID=UPI003BF08AE4
MSLSRRTSSRLISLSLAVTVMSILLLLVSYSSEFALHWLLGLDGDEQVKFRDICSLVAIGALVLAAMVNQGMRQGRK